jgi:hypothetical protein
MNGRSVELIEKGFKIGTKTAFRDYCQVYNSDNRQD